MVGALLAGTKTQTRRLITPCPWPDDREPPYVAPYPSGAMAVWCDPFDDSVRKAAPYVVGDRLYVREAWTVRGTYSDVVEVGYRASERASHTEFVEQWPVASAVPGKGQWPRWPNYGPSIHMPRWASRLWLAVTEVRIQRLQDISEADAIAEGIDEAAVAHFGNPIKAYAGLWDHLHGGESDAGWAANPWIVAVTFGMNQGNIDA